MKINRKSAFAEIEEVESQIGKRLSVIRIQKGMKLQLLAAFAGLSHQQISKYEKGLSRITAGTLLVLARRMGEPVASFFPHEGEILRLHEMVKAEAEFIHLLRALDKPEQKLLLIFMRSRLRSSTDKPQEMWQIPMNL